MHRPPPARWDNSQDYPEDEEEGMAPQDPPHTTTGYDTFVPTELGAGSPDRDTSKEARRRRRQSSIDDHLRTREYRERIKEERRSQGFK